MLLWSGPAWGYDIALTWVDQATDETSYSIERSCNGAAYAVVQTTVANTITWTDTEVPPSARCCYRVRAVNASGASSYSSACPGRRRQRGD